MRPIEGGAGEAILFKPRQGMEGEGNVLCVAVVVTQCVTRIEAVVITMTIRGADFSKGVTRYHKR